MFLKNAKVLLHVTTWKSFTNLGWSIGQLEFAPGNQLAAWALKHSSLNPIIRQVV